MKLGGKSEHHRARCLACLSETVQSISDLESEGSAGNILQKRKVSQKTHIPISSQEEIERMVKGGVRDHRIVSNDAGRVSDPDMTYGYIGTRETPLGARPCRSRSRFGEN